MSDTAPQYIYLIQEREFIKTKDPVYKVGRTKKENLTRFKQYPKGSNLLLQMICSNCQNIEAQLIKIFKEHFNQRKEIGNEYFQGNYKTMIDIIFSTIKNEICLNGNDDEQGNNSQNEEGNNTQNEEENNSQNKELKFKLVCEKIGEIFPDYKNDESFGGSKKYIKLKLINGEYVINYINPYLIDDHDNYYENDCEESFDEYIILEHNINKNVADRLQYFNNLISKKVIILDKPYDMNSTNFIDKINKTKFNITIENYDEFKRHHLTDIKSFYCAIEAKIIQLFYCNMFINSDLHSTMVKEDDNYDIYKKFKRLNDFDSFRIDIGTHDYNIITLYKINSKWYDYNTYLRKYTPYLIRWDVENNYYILNRDYEYIGLNKKYIEYEEKGQTYLFNDGTKPWDEKQYLIKMCNKYKKIIKENSLKISLNSNTFTKNIISLFG
jgi:hypothetical protein